MSREIKPAEPLPENLDILDDLIRRCYSELLKSIKENAKLGDLLKMIDMRRKLAPEDSAQSQFWNMLEEIRRETLGGGAPEVTSGPEAAATSRRPSRKPAATRKTRVR